MEKTTKLSIVFVSLVMLIVVSLLTPIVSAAITSRTYSIYRSDAGVIEKDRYDYMNADDNPLNEDIANANFQPVDSYTVGYMKDIYIDITDLGTLAKINYTGEETPPYHWLPAIEQTPVGRYTETAPVEGWVIAYNMTVYPVTMFPRDEGYLAVTLSGWGTNGWTINVIGRDTNDNWAFLDIKREVWVDNPRLLVVFFNITVRNDGSQYKPVFNVNIVIIFNKATKFVEIFQKLTLLDTSLPPECISVEFNMAFARMVIFDANPWCDRAFYGWKNVTIEDPEFFLVLSWTNKTLEKWVNEEAGYDYYGTYMAVYPVPNATAIASTWYDNPDDAGTLPDAADVWNATQLRYTYYYPNYVFLNMSDIDGDQLGDGDQALVRVEWYRDSGVVLPGKLRNLSTGWKLIMYGVYDVNGARYDGGEGGVFGKGRLTLSNRTSISAPVTTWTHTGTLGWLNNANGITSLPLSKHVTYLDKDQDGVKDEDEYDIEKSWYPDEELYWQLTYKFAPRTFNKMPPCCCCIYCYHDGYGDCFFDFLAIPAPGATPDAAGGAYLNARFTAWLVVFDVEAYNMTATVGYINPGTKMMPHIMLRLEPIPEKVEEYPARRSHYLTEDKRALIQMEWRNVRGTLWSDENFWIISVAGVHPNLVTYYFNDFTPIVRAVGGDYQWQLVVLPYGGVIDIGPYVGTEKGLGVIALAKDHFGNTALLVYGLDAQDTYWTAYYVAYYWPNIQNLYGQAQAMIIQIDYSETGPAWGTGEGVPIAHPEEPGFNVLVLTKEYEVLPLPSPP